MSRPDAFTLFAQYHLGLLPDVQAQFRLRAIALAAAHEIGHFLLRTTKHARTGLMRAEFTVADIMWHAPSLARLDGGQRALLMQRMRDGLLARAPTADAAPQ